MKVLNKIYGWLLRITSKPLERGEASAGYWHDKIRTYVLERCKNAKGDFLETGCGEGLFLARVAKDNPDIRIYGVDISQDVLDKAAARLKEFEPRIHLSLADIRKLRFDNDFFATVVCLNVLLNMDSIDVVKEALREISRVLKPGGRFICDIRNSRNPFVFFKYKLAPYYDETRKSFSLKAYRINIFEQAINACGLKVIKKTPLDFPWSAFAPVIIIEAEKC